VYLVMKKTHIAGPQPGERALGFALSSFTPPIALLLQARSL
jgi:hypothetical protein